MTDSVNPTLVPVLSSAFPDPLNQDTFNALASALFDYFVGSFATGVNLVSQQAYQNALASYEAAQLASAMANFKGAWSALPATALNKPASVSHSGKMWVLVNNLANPTTSQPGVTADWVEYQKPAAVDVPFDATDTGAIYGGAAPTNLQTAMVTALAGPNLIQNWEMRNVVRRVGAIPPGTYAAGVFVIDRFKAGAGGMTRDYTTNQIDGSIRILTGTLVHSVPINLYTGAKLCIAWDGFAKARVAGGAYQASPIVYTAPGNATSLDIEWQNDGTGGSSSGTVSNIRMRRGVRDLGTGPAASTEDLRVFLRRYFRRVKFDRQANMAAGELDRTTVSFPDMVATPTAAIEGTPDNNTNTSAFSVSVLSDHSMSLNVTANAAGAVRYAATYTLDAGW